MTKLHNKSERRQRLRDIKQTVDRVIREQGKCEPSDYFAEYYKRADGWAKFCEYTERVEHWNGHEHVSVAEAKFRKGVATGTAAAMEDLQQDKYKTLYINDTIGLHDRQHVVMLQSTGLQGKLTGEFWNMLVHFRHFF